MTRQSGLYRAQRFWALPEACYNPCMRRGEPIASWIRDAAGWLGLDVTPSMLVLLERLLLPSFVRLAEEYAAIGDLDAIEFLTSAGALASRPEASRIHWN